MFRCVGFQRSAAAKKKAGEPVTRQPGFFDLQGSPAVRTSGPAAFRPPVTRSLAFSRSDRLDIIVPNFGFFVNREIGSATPGGPGESADETRPGRLFPAGRAVEPAAEFSGQGGENRMQAQRQVKSGYGTSGVAGNRLRQEDLPADRITGKNPVVFGVP